MLRKRSLVLASLVASSLLAGTVVVTHSSKALAQEVIDLDEEEEAPADKDKKKGGKDEKKKKKGVDIDLDEGEASEGGGPVSAGQMTEEAAAAKRLFDQQRW